MPTVTALDLVDLDYDSLRANLVTFFQSQPVFTDYDFTGSGLSQLLNILAYNSSFNGYLANATINEGFLGSAVKRGNAISRAKEDNYTPTSATAAMAIVDIVIPTPVSTMGIITLPQYTAFSSNVGTATYNFYNLTSMVGTLKNGQYNFNGVELYEGTIVTNSFTVTANATLADITFTLPNDNIDTRTISVVIQNTLTDSTTSAWNFTEDMTNVDGNSQVYYIQCNAQEQYQIQFGDGVLGAKPLVGNIVIVTYLVTDADAANVVSTYPQTFTTNAIAGNAGLVINTVQNSTGGAPEETIDEIKFNAPLAASANNRAVTALDYYGIISKYATSVQSCTVYGGEDATPPVYGKVYISLDPVQGYYIPDSIKTEISNNILQSRNMMTIIPEYVDPDYVYLTFTISSEYDPTQTTLGPSDIVSAIQTSVNTFLTTNIGKFKQTFYFSKLSNAIDNSNASILGNMLSFNIQKRFTVSYGNLSYITVNFTNQIQPKSVYSNCFTYYLNNVLNTCNLQDDGLGNLQIMNFTNSSVLLPSIGTVDYTTGIVQINGLNINGITGAATQLNVNATPVIEVSNVIPSLNQIVKVDDSVASVADNIMNGITITASPIVA